MTFLCLNFQNMPFFRVFFEKKHLNSFSWKGLSKKEKN